MNWNRDFSRSNQWFLESVVMTYQFQWTSGFSKLSSNKIVRLNWSQVFLDGRISIVSKNKWFSNGTFHNQVKNSFLNGRITKVSKNKCFNNGIFHNYLRNSFLDGRITTVSKNKWFNNGKFQNQVSRTNQWFLESVVMTNPF